MLSPLRLVPELKERVWGGSRLGPGIGESWLIHEANTLVTGGSLADATAALEERLLGRRGIVAAGGRFPLLIKILDAAEWLSVQVHPDDEQAARLEGPGELGKAEAWHILEAAPGGSVMAGLRAGTTAELFERAIREGAVLEIVEELDVVVGDTIFICPGLVHALGPGVLLYEVQQSSDVTYRVWDWNRTSSPKRHLHVAQSLAVTRLEARPRITRGRGDACEQFALELIGPMGARVDTRGESFHAVTLAAGAAVVAGETLRQFESVIVPAEMGGYGIEPIGEGLRALVARVP